MVKEKMNSEEILIYRNQNCNNKYGYKNNIDLFSMEQNKFPIGMLFLRKKDNETFTIFLDNQFEFDIPKEKFEKMLERKQGQYTSGNIKFQFPKQKKSENGFKFILSDKVSKDILWQTGDIWSPHFNTPEWEQLINFTKGAHSFCSLLYSEKFNKIGLDINIVLDSNLKNSYPTERKSYSYSIKLKDSEYNKSHLDQIMNIIDLYYSKTKKDIIIQDKPKLEEILGFNLSDKGFYNFDQHYKKTDLLEASSKNYIEEASCKMYEDEPYSTANNLIIAFLNPEIIAKQKESIALLISDKNTEIFKFEKILDTEYEKDIKYLDPGLIIPENTEKLIELIHSRQLSYKWGSQKNMLPISLLLYSLIKKDMFLVVIKLLETLKEKRNDNIFDNSSNFLMLNVALKNNGENREKIIDVIFNSYSKNFVQQKLRDLCPIIKLELIENLDSLNNPNLTFEKFKDVPKIEIESLN